MVLKQSFFYCSIRLIANLSAHPMKTPLQSVIMPESAIEELSLFYKDQRIRFIFKHSKNSNNLYAYNFIIILYV